MPPFSRRSRVNVERLVRKSEAFPLGDYEEPAPLQCHGKKIFLQVSKTYPVP